MTGQNLQAAFAALQASHKAVIVSAPIHWRYEAAAILWELQHGPAVRFDDVVGYDVPLVGNMLNTRDKLASALGIEAGELQDHVLAAMDSLVPPVVVPDAACQAHVRTTDLDVLAELPLPQISEADGGRYISAGILVCRDPVTGRQNMAICRMQAKEAGRLGVYMAPTHSAQFLGSYRRLGRRMEIAVAIGCHPAVTVASQMLVPHDEMQIAGGLSAGHCRWLGLGRWTLSCPPRRRSCWRAGSILTRSMRRGRSANSLEHMHHHGRIRSCT